MAGLGFQLKPVVVPKIKTKYRIIQTPIPVPQSLSILSDIEKYESRSMHGQLPVVWDKAEGVQVYDAWGNKWLDFTSTIFVANAGHSHPKIRKALVKTIKKPLLHTYTYGSEIRRDYLKYLIENTPAQFEKAFFLSAGTEATEVALKLMRMNGRKSSDQKINVIAIENNWHGRTLGAQMLSSNQNQKAWIGYLDPHIHHLPFPYPWNEAAVSNPVSFFKTSLQKLCQEKKLNPKTDICGVMLETFQGWGAVFYPKAYVQAIAEFCKENNALLAFDEMQAGFARTGKLFGYMHYEVQPDLLCCGKGASSGLPLAIVLGSQAVMDLPDIGSMSSTHSANPLVCAAGLANLKIILEEDLIQNSNNLGMVFHEALNQIQKKYPKHIRCVLGQGLLAALIFTDEKGTPLNTLCDSISEKCMQKGLLVVHTGRESIKLAPPLVINKEALLEGIAVIDEAIAEAIHHA